ncbi:baseplate J/gp47 family protein [Aeromonas dhakensis]|uniref:baseplate J/gp47 family protein n=1 Tax=Aeromonas dhakensis TaxID=196024 RepID=UPI002379F470|nr:baseplate J/gp47 family protein [Aeromonas dhakensis]MDD9211169.1 baseplate J/gp47 family protein [Aeromonas dhakensis]
MNLRPNVDFMALLAEAGVPTTEQAMEAELKKEVVAAGSLITNDSDVSPFWRLVRGVVITPALWLVRTLLAGHVLPNTFAATAKGTYLTLKAWDVGVTAKAAQAARGIIEFVKRDPTQPLVIPDTLWIATERINGVVYRLRPTQSMISPAGESVARVVCEAEFAGSAWNLAPGYYCLPSDALDEVVAVRNPDGWLLTPGADAESDEELALRIRNQFSTAGRFHIDSVYRAMLAAVAGIRPDLIFFEHDAPRGPGTANAYILLDVGQTTPALVAKLNEYVAAGHHGHGDDLQVMPIAETHHSLTLSVWGVGHLTDREQQALVQALTDAVGAAFRQSAAYPHITRVMPQHRFSLSRLGSELHATFPVIGSLAFDQGDIVSELAVPRLTHLQVQCHA